ncbi:MAG: aldo/keto reductase [Gammaproteobacteria bacterium]|nr:aldo/keto reductase [Gammaproteobacteria bacterium]
MIPKIQMSPEGPHFSKLVQGYWRLAEWGLSAQECLAFMKEHINLGITTVDHAHVYGNPPCESLFGEALKLEPSLREQIEIVSKCGIVLGSKNNIPHYDSSKQAIISSAELSLSRLGIDYLDVLLIHRPDFLMDADEICEAFHQLRSDGKVKYFGVSNFTSAQMSLLQSRLDIPLVTNQIELNPVNVGVLDTGILENLQQTRTRPMAWSCLGGGEIFNPKTEKTKRIVDELKKIANELNIDSIDQLIYAWVMKMPSNPVPILGTGNISRIKKAVDSLQLSLTREQWYRMLSASRGHDVA